MIRAILFASIAAALLVPSGAAAATQVEVRIHYSHFEPSLLTVARGAPVTIVLRNDDPIDHEWIVGDAGVHARHRTGTEPVHDSRPTEVSIPAHSTRTTVVTFAEAGILQMICHLPGHEQYGMVGIVRVVP
ncbi:MAG TPA: cupredoxin domain-containing protein [Candidatus Limnocylindria bacterium]|nr:cupredoxin domain-containing protein [Candidatus Limnocylindria bacterium]